MNRSLIFSNVKILLLFLLFSKPAFSQFMRGTIINIDTAGIIKDYDFNEKLKLDDLVVDYQQVGKYQIDEGSRVFIVYNGGLMQNFEYSQGKINITEKIIIGDITIPREIIYEDGIPTIKVTPAKQVVKPGIYVDLNNLWLTIRKENTIKELVDQMNSQDLNIRVESIKVLATLGKPAFSALVNALKDSLHVIREYAAIALGKLKDTRAIKQLIPLLDDNAWNVRLRAAWSLGQMKGKQQIAPLNQLLKKEENDFVRLAITKALKKLE